MDNYDQKGEEGRGCSLEEVAVSGQLGGGSNYRHREKGVIWRSDVARKTQQHLGRACGGQGCLATSGVPQSKAELMGIGAWTTRGAVRVWCWKGGAG